VKRKFRLTRNRDFSRVRQNGKTFAHPLLVLITHPNESTITRVGIITSRMLGNAVQRNRTRRQVKAIMQDLFQHTPSGWDLVILTRKKIVDVPSHEIKTVLKEILIQAGLWKENG
jgi:ribonuclease P protein component